MPIPSTLAIAADLSLPLTAVTQKSAILGTSGSGKSYTAQKLAELMLDAGAQIVALDPVGIWWALRLLKDGKHAAYEQVFVFGGDHGDMPITPESGSLLGRMLAERGISAVLDISHFTTSETKRFATNFAEAFFQTKKSHKSPVHLFLEECQTILPQKPEKDEGTMLNRWERLIKIGRNYGAGFSMISQQPQSVSKRVLNLADTMYAMRTIGHHERAAILNWVKDVVETETDLVASLPKLKTGTAHIWSPSWLGISRDIHILPKITFDAGKTPEMGTHTVEPRPLTPIDVEKLKSEMSEMIEKVKQDDPRELRKQVAELKQQLSRQPNVRTAPAAPVHAIGEKEIERKIRAAVDERDKLWQSVARQYREEVIEYLQLADSAISSIGRMKSMRLDKDARIEHLTPLKPEQEYVRDQIMQHIKQPSVFVQAIKQAAPSSGNGNLREGARRMLAALCQFYPGGMPEGRLRSHAGLKKSGTFSTYKSDLLKGGYMERRGSDLFATQTGLDFFGTDIPSAPSTTEEVVALWSNKLREGARRMLNVLIAHGGETVPREQLFEESELAKSGTASTYLSDLTRAQLAITSRDGVAANRSTLLL